MDITQVNNVLLPEHAKIGHICSWTHYGWIRVWHVSQNLQWGGVWRVMQTAQKHICGTVEHQDPAQIDLQNYSPDGWH